MKGSEDKDEENEEDKNQFDTAANLPNNSNNGHIVVIIANYVVATIFSILSRSLSPLLAKGGVKRIIVEPLNEGHAVKKKKRGGFNHIPPTHTGGVAGSVTLAATST